MRKAPRLLGIALIATMSMSIVACSTPGTEPTPSSTAVNSPTPSTASSPGPTPSFDMADTSTWLIGEDGIGHADLGSETIADAVSPTFTLTDRCEGLEYYEASGSAPVGFGVISHPGEGVVSGVSIRVPGDTPLSGPLATSPLTESGIGLGATLDELTAAEPSGTFDAATENPEYVVGAGTRWIVFEVSEAEPDRKSVV